MKWNDYIKDQGVPIFLLLLANLFLGAFLTYLAVPPPLVAVVGCVFLFTFLAMLAYDYGRRREFYQELADGLKEPEELAYLSELLREPGFLEGKLMYRVIRADEKYCNDRISENQEELRDYRSFIETWTHEIKTPVAVMRLLLENNRSEISGSLLEEVDKMEAYIEQILYYTKSGSLEEDYAIRPVSLKSMVNGALRKNANMMIAAGAVPRLCYEDEWVLADSKWMEFILGQILSNAVKYQKQEKTAEIIFSVRKQGRTVGLSVKDHGVGIPEQDLGKVCKKGFTGENGRRFKKSTGMGLYLCKTLCDKMNVPMELTSKEGEGTEVTFLFPAAENRE